jgi:integrase
MTGRCATARLYQSAARRTGTDLAHLQLRGPPHDLRHTFSTWLEDAGGRDRDRTCDFCRVNASIAIW